MKILDFIKNINKTNAVLLKEDIEKNIYYFLIGPSPRKNVLIDDTLNITNELLSSTYGDLMNKKLKNNLIDEITLFVARICRNYDNLPPENQFKAEYNHFIKSMIK